MTTSILLVDDERGVLNAWRRVLSEQPYQVFTAISAHEAMAVLKHEPIDAVVTDEHMLGMRGTELLARISDAYPSIVRIIITGSPENDTVIRALNEGHAFCFLKKPCSREQLLGAVQRGLEHKQSLSRQITREMQNEIEMREVLG